ncbi:hypothetical protein CYMTET_18984, partial [Cymbomonas tetramitiformis]
EFPADSGRTGSLGFEAGLEGVTPDLAGGVSLERSEQLRQKDRDREIRRSLDHNTALEQKRRGSLITVKEEEDDESKEPPPSEGLASVMEAKGTRRRAQEEREANPEKGDGREGSRRAQDRSERGRDREGETETWMLTGRGREQENVPKMPTIRHCTWDCLSGQATKITRFRQICGDAA